MVLLGFLIIIAVFSMFMSNMATAAMMLAFLAPVLKALPADGKGKIGLTISKYFFELMEKNGIPTHYINADIDKGLMQVRNLTVPKLEFVLRYFTAGSMCRRFTLDEGIVFDPAAEKVPDHRNQKEY